MSEPTLPVSQPSAEGFYKSWIASHPKLLGKGVIWPGDVSIFEFAEAFAAERDRELQQAQEELDHFRTVTDYARSESGSGPGDLQGYIEQLWARSIRIRGTPLTLEPDALSAAMTRPCIPYQRSPKVKFLGEAALALISSPTK